MIKLAKNNPIIKDIKELQKKTVNDLVYVDDLSSIKTIEGTNNVIDTFIYCDELQYHDDTKKLIDALIKKSSSFLYYFQTNIWIPKAKRKYCRINLHSLI